jgi:selenide,water dikinase
VTLIEAADPVPAVGGRARQALLMHLERAGVGLVTQAGVVKVDAGGVTLADGRLVAASFTIGAAGTRAQDWLEGTGLALEGGFIRVGPTLQSESDPAVFAAGDVAHMVHAPRPKAGVFAVRQAPVLFANLRAALQRRPLRRYTPQRDYLKLVSTGGRNAVADKWGLPLDGALLWKWKDRIDRAFMARLLDLPVMDQGAGRSGQPSDPAPEPPLCGGCGAKVGRGALQSALARLPSATRDDVEAGAGDDAAVLLVGGTRQVLTTDHLRAFTLDPGFMAHVTAIHALGDVWSMGATAQVALAQIILPPMQEAKQAETLREIMDAAARVFTPEGAVIVGGHTSLGAELTIGFTLTGLCRGPAITHRGARPGDRLILTKPIGTGVILAAEMAGRAMGRTVAAAFASMARSSGPAARRISPHAHAMTDVTGFGLAGHLLTILDASGVGARIDRDAIPCLAGAQALIAAGMASSLLPANRASVAGRLNCANEVDFDLLCDPQTAGGLLAAVPPDVAEDILRDLCDGGETAAVIGEIVEGPAGVTLA